MGSFGLYDYFQVAHCEGYLVEQICRCCYWRPEAP